MGVRLSIEDEERPRRALLRVAGVVLLAAVCFFLTAVVTLSVLFLSESAFSPAAFDRLGDFLVKILKSPVALGDSYRRWWLGLQKAQNFDVFMLLPVSAPLVSFLILAAAYLRSSYSLGLWYVLRYHFANLEDIRKMGLLNGIFLVLGRFQDYVLGVNRPSAVLCFGEAGSGKTSSVAIPSILRSDSACVMAVDNSGTLAKYTSGYRSSLGKVFYFNWDLQDDPDKGSFYPHWNPLCKGNLPSDKTEQDDYLGFIAAQLTGYDAAQDKDNYWHWLVYTAFCTFLRFMLAKTAQAVSNDYFLQQIVEKGRLNKDDKDVLLSYYVLMPKEVGLRAAEAIQKDKLSVDDFLPIGSWAGIPVPWQGKEICLAMVADWLLKNYLLAREGGSAGRGCKDWLESLTAEAFLFNYGTGIVRGLQQLAYLSSRQREIVFPMLLRSLKIFRNPAVREKTSGNDFYMAQLRGVKNPQTKRWEPVTVYSTANTRSSRAIGNMFVELMMRQIGGNFKYKGSFPLAIVVDDVGQMLKIKGLTEAVQRCSIRKTYFVLLCNSLHNIENIYSREILETLVASTNYKIIMAEDNIKLSRQLRKLAVFATRSVQIPVQEGRKRRFGKRGGADAAYYYHLAKDLRSRRNLSVETRGYQILLAEGFYHRPVLTKNSHFIKDENFKDKSLEGANYFLDPVLTERRNSQDFQIPSLEDAIYDAALTIDDRTELDRYLEVIYEDAAGQITRTPDKETALADDISNRWQSSAAERDGKSDASEWWMDENAFAGSEQATSNPFEKNV